MRNGEELRNSKLTCSPNDSDDCVHIVGDPCPQEIEFAEFRSGHKTKILSFWLAIYDNLDGFLEKYDTSECHNPWNACSEMFNTRLLQVDEKTIEELIEQWNNLLQEADPYLIGDTAGEVESMNLVFTPILTHLQWIIRNNQTTYKEYMNDVIPMIRGMQNAIKYELLHQFVGEQERLPRKFHPTYEDFGE